MTLPLASGNNVEGFGIIRSREMVLTVIIVLGTVALLVGSAAAVYWATQREELPGKLVEKEGRYESAVDLSIESVRIERERDFCRICKSQTVLHYATIRDKSVSELRLLELEDSIDFSGYIRQINERYFSDESSILTSYGYALISATMPFEFAMQFQIPPNFASNEFVLLHDASKQSLRVLWAAFYQDFFITLLSDPLLHRHYQARSVVQINFSYSCQRRRHMPTTPLDFTLSKTISEWLAASSSTLLS